MCTFSMVHDHFDPRIPRVQPIVPDVPWPPTTEPKPSMSLEELTKLIRDFQVAGEAAKKVDELTKQPDCVDPEKAKLSERIAELEATLSKHPEFVLVTGVALEPGTYRVVDGQLWKVVSGAPTEARP